MSTGFIKSVLPKIAEWGMLLPKIEWKRPFVRGLGDLVIGGMIPDIYLSKHRNGCELIPIAINGKVFIVATSEKGISMYLGVHKNWPNWENIYKRNLHQKIVRLFQEPCHIDGSYSFHLRLIGWSTAYFHGFCKKRRSEEILDRSLAILAAQHMAGNEEATPYFLDLLKEKSAYYG